MLRRAKELINPALEWLAAMDRPAFNRVFRGSPLERTRRKRILRNVAIAMGNSGEESFFRSWTRGLRARTRCSRRPQRGLRAGSGSIGYRSSEARSFRESGEAK